MSSLALLVDVLPVLIIAIVLGGQPTSEAEAEPEEQVAFAEHQSSFLSNRASTQFGGHTVDEEFDVEEEGAVFADTPSKKRSSSNSQFSIISRIDSPKYDD